MMKVFAMYHLVLGWHALWSRNRPTCALEVFKKCMNSLGSNTTKEETNLAIPLSRLTMASDTRHGADAPKLWFFRRHSHVHLFVPNLIGYARILCALGAFSFGMTSPGYMIALYFLSFACDELDGRFARMLGQQSTLGAVLDMVTDRVATCGLVTVLFGRIAAVLPQHGNVMGISVDYFRVVVTVVLIGLVFLDVFSHWFHMYASLAQKGLGSSHKDTSKKDTWLLRMYYKHRIFMGYCCVSVEVMYLALYLLTFETGEPLLQWLYGLVIAAAPGFLLKQVANTVQLRDASKHLIELDGVSQQRRRTRSSSRQLK